MFILFRVPVLKHLVRAVYWWVLYRIQFRKFFGFWPWPTTRVAHEAAYRIWQLSETRRRRIARLKEDRARFVFLTETQAEVRLRLKRNAERATDKVFRAEFLSSGINIPEAFVTVPWERRNEPQIPIEHVIVLDEIV